MLFKLFLESVSLHLVLQNLVILSSKGILNPVSSPTFLVACLLRFDNHPYEMIETCLVRQMSLLEFEYFSTSVLHGLTMLFWFSEKGFIRAFLSVVISQNWEFYSKLNWLPLSQNPFKSTLSIICRFFGFGFLVMVEFFTDGFFGSLVSFANFHIYHFFF